MRFLSSEWFDELDSSLKNNDVPPPSSKRLLLGQIVTDGPDGSISYVIAIGGGTQPQVIVGSTEDAAVTLIETYETATAIANGAPASQLLSGGNIKVRGDANALLLAQDYLVMLGKALGTLRQTTEF